MNRFLRMVSSVKQGLQNIRDNDGDVMQLTADEILNRLPYTIDNQTKISRERMNLWLQVLKPLEQLYIDLDEYTSNATLTANHILEDDAAMADLIEQIRNIYHLVKDDKYFSYILFGMVKIEEEHLATFFYRHGKGSVKPCLYMILRFEIECNHLLAILNLTEKMIVEYEKQLIDGDLLETYLKECRNSSHLLLGLFDIGSQIELTESQKTLNDWLKGVEVGQLVQQDVKDKLELLFGKTIVYRHPLAAPSNYFVQAINPE